jgi:hypothetical protein
MDDELDFATDLEFFGCAVLIMICAGVMWAIL